jgi:hypothetical protein
MITALGPLSELWVDPTHSVVASMEEHFSPSSDPLDPAEGILRDLLDSSNKDHERELAQILLDWTSEKSNFRVGPRLLGVTGFHSVWEDMCRVCLSSAQLPQSHREIASQPWIAIEDVWTELPSQRPDILVSTATSVGILDAKWYTFDAGDYPSTPDVVKQMVYQLSLLNTGQKTSLNCFLLPTTEIGIVAKKAGRILMGGQDHDIRFPQIDIVAVEWAALADRYSSHTSSYPALTNWFEAMANG